MSKWKTFAIILLVILLAENLLIGVGYWQLQKEEKQTLQCWYEICEEYSEAILEGGLCSCYDYDVLGNYKVAKTVIMD